MLLPNERVRGLRLTSKLRSNIWLLVSTSGGLARMLRIRYYCFLFLWVELHGTFIRLIDYLQVQGQRAADADVRVYKEPTPLF